MGVGVGVGVISMVAPFPLHGDLGEISVGGQSSKPLMLLLSVTGYQPAKFEPFSSHSAP